MRPQTLGFLLAATASLTFPATAQQHTAIYTTTLANNDTPHVITTVIVTLLMPREYPNYPKDGAPLTGTAISHFTAGAPPSTWSTTAELVWTLSGNAPLGVGSTNPAPTEVADTTLTSVYTTTEYHTSDIRGVFISRQTYEWFSTFRVTLVEAVGTAYPATIVRTGYTHLEATMVGGIAGVTPVYSGTSTVSYQQTTTMVLVEARPSAGVGTVG